MLEGLLRKFKKPKKKYKGADIVTFVTKAANPTIQELLDNHTDDLDKDQLVEVLLMCAFNLGIEEGYRQAFQTSDVYLMALNSGQQDIEELGLTRIKDWLKDMHNLSQKIKKERNHD